MVACAAALLGGCATSGNPKDPIEGFNRAMYSVHEGIDTAVMKPVATGYDAVLPDPVQTGVSNFFANIGDIMVSVNNLLQGKPGQAVSDAGRFLVNTTVGVLGVFDVASTMGMEKHDEDFGQTFGRWGAEPGAYVFIPMLGPRTARDTVGVAFDLWLDPMNQIDNVPTRNSLWALRAVNTRANLLPADKVIEEAALDKYAYIRDAYLQNRRNRVYDGNPPPRANDEE
ncbi:MAG TPA: VacJ family lipoprotein [Rhodocyclaceae bacterium]|nr:VacJ family lipoprotein [Rhodocyclaceae bacterium]